MTEDNRSKLTKVLAGLILPALLVMVGAHLLIQISDRFTNNETAWSFYIESTDMTCVVARSRGQEVMWCADGDLRVQE